MQEQVCIIRQQILIDIVGQSIQLKTFKVIKSWVVFFKIYIFRAGF